ncbi:dirigent protein 10 isoform X3 [Suricata suricatta]|uniref:dirigent protein 10 isoform X3 n=1 Tax=Suricata suricatta TaxID=37032 RepID=UPI0011560C95|nr:dirigent protein 10 isoform X3 [Suricata suricatta]
MPQGEGFHAARGGAPGVGAGRGTVTGGTSELVPVEGGAAGLGTELGQVGGGAWPLEEELEQAEGGASGLETEGDGAQALGAGLQSASPLLTELRHEAELGPDSTVHLPECPDHCCGGRGQTEAADRGQEAGRPLSHQVAQGGCPAHALHGEAGRWDRI